MITVSIYIDNSNISNVDCSDLMRGNPGIGGTEYSVLFLAQCIKIYSQDIRVVLLAEKDAVFPPVDKILLVNGLDHVDSAAISEKSDILVISSRKDGKPLPESFFQTLKTKTIIWGHNFYYSDYCDLIAECKNIKANVFVGRQQYDKYVDHKIIEKSFYIYNMYPFSNKEYRRHNENHVVTYIGSLVPEKGFHVLASIWKRILSAVPDAELNVIGSGKLYNRSSAMGEMGIAETNYEKKILSYLSDDKGDILSSVHFLGVLGAEKETIIENTSVGVVNPTGRTETFGISALDFESKGVPVVTIAKNGFLDTVSNNRTGLLCNSINSFTAGIIDLLKNKDKNNTFGNEGIKFVSQFDSSIIIKEWFLLFDQVINETAFEYRKPRHYMSKDLKWLRMTNRFFKKKLGIQNGFSVIGLETFIRKLLSRIGV